MHSKLPPDIELGMEHYDAKVFSNCLFDELSRKFEQLKCCLGGAAASTSDDAKISQEDMILLLRCCMSVLPLLEFDFSLVVEKCRVLMTILSSLCAYARGGEDPRARSVRPSIIVALLEVFTENLVVHHQMRRYFVMTDSAVAMIEKVFVPPGCCGDLHVIQELVSCHFLSKASNEQNFNKFMNSLFWSKKAMIETPELGLAAALVLVHMGNMFSLPNIVRAHLILLASRCIHVQSYKDNLRLNGIDLDHHMLAFELSVNLYVRYLSTLDIFENCAGEDQPTCYVKILPFSSYIQDATGHKLDCQINELLAFCRLHSSSELSGNEEDILSSSVGFIEENQHIFREQFRQESKLIMKGMILNFLSWTKDKNAVHATQAELSQETICLAAALKLMSSSLLQILFYIRQTGITDGRKKRNHSAVCKEYNVISETARCLGKYEANKLHPHSLLDLMGKRFDREGVSTLMLAHFASLSMYSLSMRLGFLWKGCIIMMMAVMDLVIVEEGNLGTFRLLSSLKESACSPYHEENNSKGLLHRRSTAVIASQFKNIQQIYLKDEAKCPIDEASRSYTLDSGKFGVYKCNGRAFFECLPEYQRNPYEWDDLVDFVECKEGKDYSSWMRQEQKFRQWKHERRIRKKQLSGRKKMKSFFKTREPEETAVP